MSAPATWRLTAAGYAALGKPVPAPAPSIVTAACDGCGQRLTPVRLVLCQDCAAQVADLLGHGLRRTLGEAAVR